MSMRRGEEQCMRMCSGSLRVLHGGIEHVLALSQSSATGSWYQRRDELSYLEHARQACETRPRPRNQSTTVELVTIILPFPHTSSAGKRFDKEAHTPTNFRRCVQHEARSTWPTRLARNDRGGSTVTPESGSRPRRCMSLSSWWSMFVVDYFLWKVRYPKAGIWPVHAGLALI